LFKVHADEFDESATGTMEREREGERAVNENYENFL